MRYVTLFFLFITALFAHEKLEKVSLQLQWLDQFQFAGYYMAKEKGFYEDAGFDVEIKKYGNDVDAVKDVLSGKTTYGIGRSSLILYFAQGKEISLLSAVSQSSPITLIALESSGIKSIKDFEHKKIMMTEDAIGSASVYAMIKSAQVDEKSIDFQKHTFNLEQLINKEVDLYAGYSSNEPFLLQERNVSYRCFSPRESGFDFYSDILFTSQKEANEHPQRVARFQEASLRGWKYAFENIDETVEIIYKKYNALQKSKEALHFEAEELKKLAFVGDIPLGMLEITKMKRILDIYRVMGLVASDVDIQKALFKSSRVVVTPQEISYLEEKKEIRICVPNLLAPLAFEENGKLRGIGDELLKELQKHINTTFRPVFAKSWKECLTNFKEGKCDVMPIATESMCNNFLHVTSTYHYEPLVVVTHNTQNYIVDMQSVMEKNFAATKDNPFVHELQRRYPKLRVSYVNSLNEGFAGVEDGKYFGYIDTFITTAYAFKNTSNGHLKIAGQFEEKVGMRFGVARDEALLYTIFEKGAQEIEKMGIDKMINRWITINYVKSTSFAYIKEVLGVAILLFFVFWYRQHLLDKKNKELEALKEDLQRRVQEAVQEMQQKDSYLLHKSRLAQMGEMISMVAHQWRQPLSSIAALQISLLMAIELEEYDLSDAKERDKFVALLEEKLKKIGAQTQELSAIISDFSDFYRPSKLQEEVHLNTLLLKASNLLEDTLLSENVKLHLELESQSTLKLFQNEFLQALLNIINNAREQLNEKRIKDGVIVIKSYDKEDVCVVEISDNALGIDEKIREKIFDPYFSTKFDKNGTGLGLYMVKNIVEQYHKGKIYAQNTLDGAKFTIEIGRQNEK
ncbi:MAG: ABC transporter substrate-binding protein [Sulfurimonas sp.]|uniref:ABC transporter substrate-binding protein n=1 Tax=Sulfurimonas sp. TaxID=2022749 RepID=UPI00261F64E1|nr:ABC transporter substrate-binding protein [Sulfurimonas sp.]MDD2652013.1 ABC transporter substrate-binding protein [Sulfurimonas sp.]MDD3451861.1 ABC transporter substrate-binding protein [Sulfurimonas sp.]